MSLTTINNKNMGKIKIKQDPYTEVKYVLGDYEGQEFELVVIDENPEIVLWTKDSPYELDMSVREEIINFYKGVDPNQLKLGL